MEVDSSFRLMGGEHTRWTCKRRGCPGLVTENLSPAHCSSQSPHPVNSVAAHLHFQSTSTFRGLSCNRMRWGWTGDFNDAPFSPDWRVLQMARAASAPLDLQV